MAMLSSVMSSLVISCISVSLYYMLLEQDMLWLTVILIPAVSYVISVISSAVIQYINCNTVDATIMLSDLFVLATTFIASIILYAEQQQVFAIETPTEGSTDIFNNGKIQFFTSIVKAAIPTSVTEDKNKMLFVYFYWIFWMSVLPLYFLSSIQSMCGSSSPK